jgi:hypothetical protein
MRLFLSRHISTVDQILEQFICQCLDNRAGGIEETAQLFTGSTELIGIIGKFIRDACRTLVVVEESTFGNVVW